MKRKLCIVILGACATWAGARPVEPGERFPGTLLDVRAPHTAGWRLAAATDASLAFVRRAAGSPRSEVATVTLFRAPDTLDRDGFLALVRRAVEAESPPQRFRTIESRFEHSDERGYPCVRHHSLSDDLRADGRQADGAPPRLELHALYCRHPRRAGLGFSAAYSSRGPEPDAAAPEAARRFIDGVVVPAGDGP